MNRKKLIIGGASLVILTFAALMSGAGLFNGSLAALPSLQRTERLSLLKLQENEKEKKLQDEAKNLQKTERLPQTLREISQAISEIKKEITSFQELPNKTSYDTAPLNKMLDELTKNVAQIEAALQKKQDTAKQIEALRAKSLPLLLRTESYLRTRNSLIEQALRTSQLRLLRLLQSWVPPPPLVNFIPPVSAEERTIRTALCIPRWERNQAPLAVDDATLRQQFQGVVDYYEEVSFHNAHFSLVSVVNNGRVWDGPRPVTFDEEANFAAELCDPDLDYTQIDALVIYPSLIAGGGLGGRSDIATAEGVIRMPVAEISNFFFEDNNLRKVMEHELGHAVMSLDHANRIECGNSAFNAGEQGCTVINYGNVFDRMGGLEGHFGGRNKLDAGNWITRTRVTRDGDYILSLIEQDMATPQLLFIPYAENPLCIEFRKPVGLDQKFSIAEMAQSIYHTGGMPPEGGVLLNICRERLGDTDTRNYLIDMTPHLLQGDSGFRNHIDADILDPFLLEGAVFSSPDLGITLSWQRENDNSIRMHVDINEARMPAQPRSRP